MLQVKRAVSVALRDAVRDERHSILRYCGTSADNKTGLSKVINERVILFS